MPECLPEVRHKLLACLIPLFGQEPIAKHVNILPGRILPTGVDCHGCPHQRGVAGRIAAVRSDGVRNLTEKGRGITGSVADVELFIKVRYLDCTDQGRKPRFLKVEPPTDTDIANVVQKISRRVIRTLRRLGYLEAGIDDARATGDDAHPASSQAGLRSTSYCTCPFSPRNVRLGRLSPRRCAWARQRRARSEPVQAAARAVGKVWPPAGGALAGWRRDKAVYSSYPLAGRGLYSLTLMGVL